MSSSMNFEHPLFDALRSLNTKGMINLNRNTQVYNPMFDFFKPKENRLEPIPGYEGPATNHIEQDFHFLFIGVTGCGKSLLAHAINEISPMLYGEPPELWGEQLRLLDSTAPDKHQAIYNLHHWLSGKTSFLDDLGTEPPTPAARWFMGNLLQEQHKAILSGTCKRSIITTNLPKISQNHHNLTEYYGDRVVSRLMETYKVFFFDDYDFRSEHKRAVV